MYASDESTSEQVSEPTWLYFLGAALNLVPSFGIGYLLVGAFANFFTLLAINVICFALLGLLWWGANTSGEEGLAYLFPILFVSVAFLVINVGAALHLLAVGIYQVFSGR